MSEDKTKILPNDDNKAPTTEPMLETILAKMTEEFANVHQEFANVHQEFANVHQEFANVHQEIASLRRDVRRIDIRFDDTESSFYASRSEVVSIRQKQKELEDRLEGLERKAS